MAKYTMDMELFAKMQEGEPYAAYQKTVLSKVIVTVLNAFSGEPEPVILQGNPGEEDSIANVWSVQEDIFFKRMNRRLFEKGLIIPRKVETKEVAQEDLPLEQASDEELIKVVNKQYKALEAILNKTESEALVDRLVRIARKEEKSEKVIKLIETRLAEIQTIKFKE